MGQKVNPTSLRLHPQNKHFDSCWFSEKRYADSIHKDLDISLYYNSILKQIQYPSASCLLEASPRKCQISLIFLNPKQLREQSFLQSRETAFKQVGHVKGKDRRRKEKTLFFERKQTTSLYGLLKRKKESLGLSSPYYLPAPFLQGLKKRDHLLSLGKTVEGGKEREKSDALTRSEDLRVSSFLRVKKKDSQSKRIMSCNVHLSKQILPNVGQIQPSRQNSLQLKKGVCSNIIGLTISHYFLQRNLSGNFLSATSRFLLLETLSSFFKKRKDWSKTFDEFSLLERKPYLDVSHQVSAFDKFKNDQIKNEPFSRDLFFLQGEKRPNQAEKRGTHWGDINQQGGSHLLSHLRKSSIYTYHIESIISNRLKSSCKIFLLRAQNVAQSALFIAEEIVYQLQRRNTFRQIKTKFLQEFTNKSAIKGIRVTCVGRIGGRAKKAQRARGESFRMGQTSLHLFDSKVSFASKTAFTPYGAVGVKVWVCWK